MSRCLRSDCVHNLMNDERGVLKSLLATCVAEK